MKKLGAGNKGEKSVSRVYHNILMNSLGGGGGGYFFQNKI
jgi:hypothetical protein